MIPIFVVNLKKDIHKKELISNLLSKYNIKFDFISAVYGNDLSDKFKESIYDKKQTIKNIGREMSNGEIGCILSHYNIYKHILDMNIEKAIILEDDIFIDEELKKFLTKIELIPESIELILLGYHSNQHNQQKTHSSYWGRITIDKIKLVKLVEKAYGTYGYFITNDGAKKLYEILTTEKISRPIDHYTGELDIANTYATSERLIYFGEDSKSNSSIENDRNKEIYNSTIDKVKFTLRKYLIFRVLRDTFYELKFFIKAINPRNIK